MIQQQRVRDFICPVKDCKICPASLKEEERENKWSLVFTILGIIALLVLFFGWWGIVIYIAVMCLCGNTGG